MPAVQKNALGGPFSKRKWYPVPVSHRSGGRALAAVRRGVICVRLVRQRGRPSNVSPEYRVGTTMTHGGGMVSITRASICPAKL